MSKRVKQKMRWLSLASGGLLFANGCFVLGANVLEQLLSPSASGNALQIPFSPVGGLVQFLRLFG